MDLKTLFKECETTKPQTEFQDLFNSWSEYSKANNNNWSKSSLELLRSVMLIGYKFGKQDFTEAKESPNIIVNSVKKTKKRRRRRR